MYAGKNVRKFAPRRLRPPERRQVRPVASPWRLRFSEAEPLLTLKEVAAILRLHPRTVREYVRRGELPGRVIGGRWRFNRKEVDALLRLLSSSMGIEGREQHEGVKGSSALLPPRGSDGRFEGRRVNVESVWRLPVFPARWALRDPRKRPYLVAWEDEREDRLSLAMKVCPSPPLAVRCTLAGYPEDFALRLLARPIPGGRNSLLWLCPVCRRPRRYLYPVRVTGRACVRLAPPACTRCAGLRWSSQGRYISSHRELGRIGGYWIDDDGYRRCDPWMRHPRDPVAVCNPRLFPYLGFNVRMRMLPMETDGKSSALPSGR